MINPNFFKDVPELWVVTITILVMCMSLMAFIFQCFRIYYALKALDNE